MLDNIVRWNNSTLRKLTQLIGSFASPVSGGMVDMSVYRLTVANIKLFQPDTAGAWARGLRYYNVAGDTTQAGVGLLGSGASVSRLYMGHGTAPWTTYGIAVDTNNDVDMPNDLSVDGDIYPSMTGFTFAGSWVNEGSYRNSAYGKFGNVVRLEGAAKVVAGWASYDTITTLPVGYRPSATIHVPIGVTTGVDASLSSMLRITSAGVVSTPKGGTAGSWVSFEGVSFTV